MCTRQTLLHTKHFNSCPEVRCELISQLTHEYLCPPLILAESHASQRCMVVSPNVIPACMARNASCCSAYLQTPELLYGLDWSLKIQL